MSKKRQRKVCDICGGTGQISFFQGVSRFLPLNEECDACAGTGFQFNAAPEKMKEVKQGSKAKKDRGKYKK